MIALIGARAAGKSSVGRSLASLAGRPFADLDGEIEARTGRSAADWLRRSEEELRGVEAAALRELAETGPAGLVLAPGGGAPMREESQRSLRSFVVIYLWAPADVLRARLRSTGGADRPPLLGSDPIEEVERVLAARDPTYRALADWVLETPGLGVEEAARAVAARLPGLAPLEESRLAGRAARKK